MTGPTRRALLASTALVVVGGVLPALPPQAAAATPPATGPQPALAFFSADEAAFIDAATARIIPTDESGPGAHEAGVLYFIDGQLNGAFGKASHWYMRGPFGKGGPGQGFQSSLTPAEAYRMAIKAIDGHCRSQYQGKVFAALTPDDQDAVLKDVEAGKVDTGAASSASFFIQLRANTIEGFFSDPKYGGNRDMVGWRMIGFPGARGDFVDYMDKSDQPYPLPPVSLAGHRATEMKEHK